MLPSSPDKKGRSRIRFYILLGGIALVHAAGILWAFLLIWYGHDLTWAIPAWVAFATLWFLWPIILGLHPGRSWPRFTLFLIAGVLLIAPSVPEGRWWAEDVFGLVRESPMPTPDKPIVERTEEVGSGFRRVMLAEFITGGFESIYHGEYLFYRDRKLGDFHSAAISPSRKYAAFVETDFQVPPKENQYGFHVFLFRVEQQTIARMTDKPLFDFGCLDWDEANGDLLLWGKNTQGPTRFPVQ